MAEFFAYAVDKRLAPFWLPFALRPSKDGVTITDDGTFAWLNTMNLAHPFTAGRADGSVRVSAQSREALFPVARLRERR
jgi:hypothetical protein